VAEHGGKVAIFNIERSDGDEDADFLFLGPCEESLPRVLFAADSSSHPESEAGMLT
jgi:NAD+-dependent protein deacetylase sirtuin 5